MTSKLSPRVLMAFAIVWVFWGSTYLAMRIGVAVMSPAAMAAIRFVIAGVAMLGFCVVRKIPVRPSRRDMGFLALIGVLMLGLGNMGCAWAERYLSSGLASLLFAVIPLYVALFEAVLPRGERLRAKGWAGVGLGLVGLLVLLSPGLREGRHSGLLLGSVIAVFAALAWSGASVLSRRAKLATTPFVSAGWQMLFGGLFDAVLLILMPAQARHIVWGRAAFFAIGWLVVFGSLVGYTAYIYLLEHVPVAKVATYAYINPVVAVLLGAVVLHERLVPIEYAGMVFILLAVYLVTSSKLASAGDAATLECAEAEPVA